MQISTDEHSIPKNNEQKPETVNEDGLPDIADSNKKNPIIFIIIAFIIMLGFYTFSHHKMNNDKPTEDENFNIQDSPQAPTINNQAQSTTSQSNSTPQQTQTNEDAQKALAQRIQAPIMVVDQNQNSSTNQQASDKPALSNDQNTQFMNDVTSQDTDAVQATLLQHRDTLIAQGNLIHAALETAIDSDLPGFLRAIVSEPVYSEDGSQVLIQPGSRLIGQYKSGMLQGQSRVFVVWTRLIEPNGINIQLGSPGVDSLGMAGQAADAVDYHFWQTFGTASLLSVLGAGSSNVGVNSSDQNNASQAYREALSSSLAQSAQSSLQDNTSIPPALHINQGATVMVFVAKDLRFCSSLSATRKVMVL
jgi:type IV secretory pathway VirB10-like protein